MATPARRPSSEDNYLPLDTQPPVERNQPSHQNESSHTGRPVVWGSLTALGAAAAGGAAWVAVKSFANGDKVGGGLLSGVAVFCVCASCYALSRLVGSLSNRNIQLIAPNGDIEAGLPAHNAEAVETDHEVKAAKAHPTDSREIHTTALQILNENTQNDREAVLDGSDLHESIRKRLAELETKLLALTQANGELTQANGELTQANGELTQANGELTQVKGKLEKAIRTLQQEVDRLKEKLKSSAQSRSEISIGAGLDSPGAGGIPFQTDLLVEFDEIGANVHKAQGSNNSSAFSSYSTSPAGNLSSFAAATPTSSEKTISPTARQLLFTAEDSGLTPPPKEEGN